MEYQKIQEITVLEVNYADVNHFEQLNAALRSALSKRRGFINAYTFRSIDQPNLILDIVEWESLKDAQKAVKVFSEDKLGDYIQSIKRIEYFDYVKLSSETAYSFQSIRQNDVLEFAYAHTKNESIDCYIGSRQPLFNYLGRKYNDLKQVATLQSAIDPIVFVDLIHWKDIDSCKKAQKELESHELFQNIIQHMDLKKEFLMNLFCYLN